MIFGSLNISYADGRAETIAIDKPTLTIGRSSDNDIVIGDVAISGNHAQILADPSSLQIIDLGSANGTEVDGARILAGFPQPLQNGSQIRIGGTKMTVVLSTGTRTPGRTPVLPMSNDDLLGRLMGEQVAAKPKRATQPLQRNAVAPVQQAPAAPPVVDIGLSLAPDELNVDAGTTAFASVSVINRSMYVDKIDLHVEGLQDWATLSPASHSLLPGGRGESQLIIARHVGQQAGPATIPSPGSGARRSEPIYASALQGAGISKLLPITHSPCSTHAPGRHGLARSIVCRCAITATRVCRSRSAGRTMKVPCAFVFAPNRWR
ncbi:FHA domain-containing protein [Candidatus Gracilibacteria bacterium]|nr:FHA domain-containing protein [Candidatus Gracilibacteria bacterium]